MDRSTHASRSADKFSVHILFHGDLGFFLKDKKKNKLLSIRGILTQKRSVKDAIESLGVPHPEVDFITVNGQAVDFSFLLQTNAALDVYSVSANPFPALGLQAREVRSFVADGHLGKLARDLRLLGIDVSYDRDADDRQLLTTMAEGPRALLTRDRPLLMHRAVETGYFPRSQHPMAQTLEVIERFRLAQVCAPFSRCLRCNGLLLHVTKEELIDDLQPLTRLYYNDFQRCTRCAQCYWPGSHIERLEKRVNSILNKIKSSV
ncbi:MAG: twitching motility protein PilT [Verrucomicrobia bacterium]|nr:twitching motility protein PilT [Verrucomicrobiota bacterium]